MCLYRHLKYPKNDRNRVKKKSTMFKDTEERKKDKSDNTLEAGRQKHTLSLTDFGVQESCSVTYHSIAKMGSQLCCRTQKGVRFWSSGLRCFPPVWLPE